METALQPDEVREVLRTNVRKRRTELQLTQAELAERLGTTQPFVAQLESGTSIPRLDNLAKIAESLETTPGALLTPEIFAQRG